MNWRSPRLLATIKGRSKMGEAPCHWPIHHLCNQSEPGSVVYAHSNQLIDGKGKAIKAHDYRIALLCSNSHYDCDQGNRYSQKEKFEAWDTAHRRTIGWLIEEEILVVA